MSFAGIASAQQFYTNVNVGYGLQTSKEAIGTHSTMDASFNFTDENIYGTYGGGLNFGVTPGYMITDNFGLELGLNYLMGGDVEFMRFDAPTGSAVGTSKSTQFRILPALVLSTGNDGLNAYGKVGLVVPAGGKTEVHVNDATDPNAVEDYTVEAKGQFSLGYMGAFGVSFGLSDKLSLFGELNGVNLRIKGSSSSITSYTVAGTDVMSMLDTYDKETVYVDELNSSSNNSGYNTNASTGKAKEELASTSNYNAMFINVGVKINF